MSLRVWGVVVFRRDHGLEEVAEQGEGDQPDDDGFHGSEGLERSTETDVQRRRGEEGEHRPHQENVGCQDCVHKQSHGATNMAARQLKAGRRPLKKS